MPGFSGSRVVLVQRKIEVLKSIAKAHENNLCTGFKFLNVECSSQILP